MAVCPFDAKAYEWLDEPGEFNPSDVSDIERSFAILPGGSRVAVFTESGDGNTEVVDTYGITGMKIAQISSIQERIEPIEDDVALLVDSLKNLGLVSMSKEDIELLFRKLDNLKAALLGLPPFEPANGYAEWRGAICCKVYLEGELFAYFYVSVSGASQDEDLACAASAIEVITTFFSDPNFTVIAPTLKT
ncbi:hypothetical protein IKH79_01415 [Candidatus Saccharibacteria bacterium]|nr:hypothetical protein [Candidatus Saccharibacteria bacterium]